MSIAIDDMSPSSREQEIITQQSSHQQNMHQQKTHQYSDLMNVDRAQCERLGLRAPIVSMVKCSNCPRPLTVINFVGGPCIGKTTMTCGLYTEMKIQGCSVEYVPEYAKKLIWKKKSHKLNNQHLVSMKQYEHINLMNGNVDYAITDSPLLLGAYYNRQNLNNICNIERTERTIMEWFRKFNNIVIMIERCDFSYTEVGRVHTREEAFEADKGLLALCDEHKIPYVRFRADTKAPVIVDWIERTYGLFRRHQMK